MNEAKIKASIDSLVALNNKYLTQMKVLATSIATRDSAIEDYIRDDIVNNTTGKVTNVATVNSDDADVAYDQLRILCKRVQDNTATIKDLASKFDPISMSGLALHNFNVPLVLLKAYSKSVSLPTTFLLTDVDSFIVKVKALNLDTVSIPVQIDVTSITSSTMTISATTTTLILGTIAKIKAAKLGIMLEARPCIAGSFANNPLWNPTDVPGWFNNWYNIINGSLVAMASEAGIPVIVVGSYFDLLEVASNNTAWQNMISNLKGVFPMVVTYKTRYWVTTSDYNTKFALGMFSKLDMIMVSGYFELTGLDDPTVSTLVSAWASSTKLGRSQPILAQLQAFNTIYNVPVMFGDFKYASRELTNSVPNVIATTTDLGIIVNGALKTATCGGQSYILQDSTHPAVLDDLAGKVIGDTTINPNKMQFGAGATLLVPNAISLIECSLSGYGDAFTQDFNSANSTTPVIPQQIFSFNLVAIIERKFGIIPGPTDIASKVAWIKANTNLTNGCIVSWWGYGASPLGNNSKVSYWNGSAWSASFNSSSASITNISFYIYPTTVQSDGFVYVTAYTDLDGTVTHDGITSSMIYTEDISISINFNTHDDYDLLVPTTPRRDAGICNPPIFIRHSSPYGVANFYTGASPIVSQEAQDRAYQAFYSVFGQLTWFAGFNLASESLDSTSPYYLMGNLAQATIAGFNFER